MIPTQTLESFPIFGSNATKVEPGDAKKAAGWQQADVVPAEWMNWEWYKASKGITDLNSGVSSIEKEINAVLTDMGITPAEATEDQLKQALAKIRPQMGSCSTAAGTAAKTVSITGNVLKPGSIYVIEMANRNSASNPTLSINNGTAYPICNADGTAVGNGAWVSDSTITLFFTGTKYIMATPAPINVVQKGNMKPVTSNAVACIITNTTNLAEDTTFQNGGIVRILFTADINGSDTTTGLRISFNGNSFPIKVNVNGTLQNFVAANIAANTYKYLQAYTTLEMVYNITEDALIIIGNPKVLSSYDYEVYADGSVGSEPIGTIKAFYRGSAPYGYLVCDGSTYDTTKYAALYYQVLGKNTLPNLKGRFLEGKPDNKSTGDTIAAGLPDLVGAYTSNMSNAFTNIGGTADGVFSLGGNVIPRNDPTKTYGSYYDTLQFRASDYNATYGNSSTVQPPSMCVLYCIKAL